MSNAVFARRPSVIKETQTRSEAVEDIRPGMVTLDGIVLAAERTTQHGPAVYRIEHRTAVYLEDAGTTLTVLAEVDEEVLEAARQAIARAGH